MSTQRILFAGDSVMYSTGLAYVILSLMKQFHKRGGYELGFVSISGMDVSKEEFCARIDPVLGKDVSFYNAQIMDPNKARNFDAVIEQFHPTIVVSMIDPWVQDQIAYSMYRKSFYWVNYVTIETPNYPEYCLFPTYIQQVPRKSLKEIMGSANLLVPCTTMGFNCLKQLGLNPIDPVPLGIDLELECKAEVSKAMAFNNQYIKDDDFIFFTVSTNSERKMLGKILESFWKFKQKMNDEKCKYKLYMHTDVLKQQGGTDLQSVVAHYNLSDCVIFPMVLQPGQYIPKDQLYQKIKACDCFVGLSGGEGFGYGYIEAMLHKKPLIYINYGGHVEFCMGAGLPVDVHDYTYAMNADLRFALADTTDCARQMAKMVSTKGLVEKMGEVGYEVVKKYSWDIVGQQFIDTVEKYHKETGMATLSEFRMKRIV